MKVCVALNIIYCAESYFDRVVIVHVFASSSIFLLNWLRTSFRRLKSVASLLFRAVFAENVSRFDSVKFCSPYFTSPVEYQAITTVILLFQQYWMRVPTQTK